MYTRSNIGPWDVLHNYREQLIGIISFLEFLI